MTKKKGVLNLIAENRFIHILLSILLGFLVMFAIAFFSILISQWQLRENLDDLKKKNNQSVIARQAYQKALDAKEAENAMKVKILQNRKSSTIKL